VCGADCSCGSRALRLRGASRCDELLHLADGQCVNVGMAWIALADAQEEADVGVAAVLSCFRSLKLDPRNADKYGTMVQ
jgi:hypothetical protein